MLLEEETLLLQAKLYNGVCECVCLCMCVCVCVCERANGGELNQTEVQILLSTVLKNLHADCIVFQSLV